MDSAKVTILDDPAAARKSAIQAAKERGYEYNSSIQGTVFYYTWMWVSVKESLLACFRVCMHLRRVGIVFVLWVFNGDFARDGQAKK